MTTQAVSQHTKQLMETFNMRRSMTAILAVVLASALSLTSLEAAAARKEHKPAKSVASKAALKGKTKQIAMNKKSPKLASVRGKTKRVLLLTKAQQRQLAIRNARNSQLALRSMGGRISKVSAIQSSLDDPGLQSSSALVVNAISGERIYEKNSTNIVPIASITKLMTAMVVLDARLPLDESLTVTEADTDQIKGTGSRISVGTTLTRGELMHLALMSSENRAAAALGRNYPGGLDAFVARMNQKAAQLGMRHSHFYDPTGLNSNNVSTANDLMLMVQAANRYPEIHLYSTSTGYEFVSNVTGRTLVFHNTNPLVKSDTWQIDVSKTGYINESGKCLVMHAHINNTPVVIVLLDSWGKYTRIGDAQRIRKWLETNPEAKLRAG